MSHGNLIARVNDCLAISSRTDAPKFLGFLSAEEVAQVEPFLKNSGAKFCFWGGFSLAERKFLGIFPDWCEGTDFPIEGITFRFNKAYRLTHRDFLGAVMSLKIARECVGDILVGDGVAVVFLSKTVLSYVLSEIKKVGSVGVQISCGLPEVLPEVSRKVTLRDTISSPRLDCIVAAICGASRSAAVTLIKEGKVSVNSLLCQKPTKQINSGENVTVRGKGRFMVEDMDGYSKKGRIILVYSKFV